MEKKGFYLIGEVTMFVLLNVVFLITISVFIIQQQDNKALYEEVYAKKIALIIDQASPGMTLYFNIEELKKFTEKNKEINEDTIRILPAENDLPKRITIKLSEKSNGHSYPYFTNLEINKKIERNYLILIFTEKTK